MPFGMVSFDTETYFKVSGLFQPEKEVSFKYLSNDIKFPIINDKYFKEFCFIVLII
jgi:hypothetical protein